MIKNFEIETKTNLNKLDSKIEQMNQQYILNQVEIQENFERFKTDVHNAIRGEHIQLLQETVVPLQDHILQLEKDIKVQKTTGSPENIQVIVNPSLLKSDNDEKFYGNNRENPKIFLKNIKNQAENIEGVQLKRILRNRLAGDAMLWFDIVEGEFQTMEEFEKMFLGYFWGHQTQAKIREDLFNGKYRDTYGTSRQKYAMRKYAVAKQLEPIMAEQDIITHIARHFEEEICNVISIHEISDIERLLNYLRRIDDAKLPKKRFQENRNFTEYKETRREEGALDHNNGSTKQYYDRRSYRNNITNKDEERYNYERRNEDPRRENRSRNPEERSDRYDKDRRNNQGQQNKEYRPYNRPRYYDDDRRSFPSQERRYNREERYNSNMRRSPGRNETLSQENKRQYRSPTRNDIQHDTQNTRQRTPTPERKVQFDEIAIVHHDNTDSKQNF